MGDRPHIQDLAVESGARTTPEVIAEAAYLQGLMFAATLLETGPVEVGVGWLDRAESYVIHSDPIPGRTFGDGGRFYALPRAASNARPWIPPEART